MTSIVDKTEFGGSPLDGLAHAIKEINSKVRESYAQSKFPNSKIFQKAYTAILTISGKDASDIMRKQSMEIDDVIRSYEEQFKTIDDELKSEREKEESLLERLTEKKSLCSTYIDMGITYEIVRGDLDQITSKYQEKGENLNSRAIASIKKHVLSNIHNNSLKSKKVDSEIISLSEEIDYSSRTIAFLEKEKHHIRENIGQIFAQRRTGHSGPGLSCGLQNYKNNHNTKKLEDTINKNLIVSGELYGGIEGKSDLFDQLNQDK